MGLDIGSSAVKAVELKPSGKSYKVTGFGTEPVPPDSIVDGAIIDAAGQVLGRVATEAARLLQGKHKAIYTPHIDTGDHVVIVNAAKVRLTGRKEEQKLYRYHSGYEGGVREERAKDVRATQPARIVEEAVRGMLPKTKMGEAMWRKLKVYADGTHPHASQKPKTLKIKSRSEVA